MLQPHLKELLLSELCLQAWAPYSVKERVAILQRVFDVQISRARLGCFYRENGVQRKSVKQIAAAALEN